MRREGWRLSTYKQLVGKGEEELDTVDLLLGLQRKLQLETQAVQLPILVHILLPHLHVINKHNKVSSPVKVSQYKDTLWRRSHRGSLQTQMES